MHFFLSNFHEMDLGLPDVTKFTAQLAMMHRKSKSPTGKFGFHVTTYNGNLPQVNQWTDTWEELFTINFRHFLEMEQQMQGPATEELTGLSNAMLERVIPRLLRPLETEGRHIEPSLVQ
jgi:protein-ribulosamine 3-kinase